MADRLTIFNETAEMVTRNNGFNGYLIGYIILASILISRGKWFIIGNRTAKDHRLDQRRG